MTDREPLSQAVVADLEVLVKPGLDKGLERLSTIPVMHCYQKRLRSATRGGRIAAVSRLVEDAIAEISVRSPAYAAALKKLLALSPTTGNLGARRHAAGAELDVKGETFRRHHEPSVLGVLSDSLVAMEDMSSDSADVAAGLFIDIGWNTIQQTLSSMHRDIERTFEPDVILTMSGPGSFAAYIVLSMNTRDVPVVACSTFPFRDRPGHAQKLFEIASRASTWRTISTSKWAVYLPSFLAEFPSRSRVLLFDDRIISGETQRVVRAAMEEIGLEVKTAAMIVSTENRGKVDFPGMVVDDNYAMPWGTRRGRS